MASAISYVLRQLNILFNQNLAPELIFCVCVCVCVCVCIFLGLHLWHMDIPRLGVESELHLQPTPQFTAALDP